MSDRERVRLSAVRFDHPNKQNAYKKGQDLSLPVEVALKAYTYTI